MLELPQTISDKLHVTSVINPTLVLAALKMSASGHPCFAQSHLLSLKMADREGKKNVLTQSLNKPMGIIFVDGR